ncbi:conserved hypothetical protein [uncultured Paludibacter sp.]|nr:conserved hypothetical protein [uncultured Paludibacter sp.]
MEQILFDSAIYLSLAGFVLLILAVLTGLRIIKPRARYHLHKKFALSASILVSIHALIMLYFYFFT